MRFVLAVLAVLCVGLLGTTIWQSVNLVSVKDELHNAEKKLAEAEGLAGISNGAHDAKLDLCRGILRKYVVVKPEYGARLEYREGTWQMVPVLADPEDRYQSLYNKTYNDVMEANYDNPESEYWKIYLQTKESGPQPK